MDIQAVPEEGTHRYTAVYFAIGAVFAILVLVLLFSNTLISFLTGADKSDYAYSTEYTPYEALIAGNTAFQRADALFKQGDYQAAIAAYEEALNASRDYAQEAQVKMKLAHTHREAGDFVAAIAAYKDLAAVVEYPRVMRAYAVENIGRMYYQYPFAADRIREQTFVGEPYHSFLADGADDALAYRRLFEYALEFQEIGGSASRVANWYAGEAVRLKNERANVEEILKAVASAQQHMAMAQSDLPRVVADENERAVAPEILFRLGHTAVRLTFVDGAILSDAEAWFKQAYEIAVPGGAPHDAYARFQYAAFLEEYGEGRDADIRTILAAYGADAAKYEKSSAFATFRYSATQDDWTHDRLVGLANIDAGFKAVLENLGWTAEDFARS
jgi:tetratricopeptide (TPR) repeat protein